jgi:excisionase family DNA binding protein
MTAIAAGSGLGRELDDDVLLVTVPRAARKLGISPAQMYNLIAKREVASVKIGKSRRLEPAELRRFVAARRQAADTGEQDPT